MPPKAAATRAAAGKAAPKPAAGRSKAATKPRAPLPVPEKLKRLFKSLCAQIDGGHLGNAVKTCDKILRLAPADEDALQTKLFLLLQTEQYAAALALVDADDGRAYEKAYSLYRLQRESDAGDILREVKAKDPEDRGAVHLEAQMAYRQDNFETAVELYTGLLDTAEPDSEEQADILTNLQAAQQHLDFVESGYLRALDALPSSTTSALETAPPPTQPQPSTHLLTAAAAGPAAAAAAAAGTAPPKKVRARRVPKGVVPGVTPAPDPERWLKKSERSTFGQRRRGQKGGGATQGVVLEPAGPGPVSGGGAGGGGKASKGKKKK